VSLAALPALAQDTNILPNGSFESGSPSLWNMEPGNATLTWATDQVHGGTHSLKIEKGSTGLLGRWLSGNNVRYWVDNIPSGVDIKLGSWVKTSGVNINPVNDDARWQLKFYFYDINGILIGGVPFVLNVDQTVATRDWYADTNGVATVNLPEVAYALQIGAEAGSNATGTVWFDDFIFIGRAGAWAGQNWNGFVDADSAWQYWIAPVGGNDGTTYFPGSGVTTDQARTGSSSLKVTAPVGRSSGELVYFTETVPIPANSAGKQYVLSAWVKLDENISDSVFNPSYALGFTWTWHTELFSDGGGWNEFGSGEYRFVLNSDTQDWKQYQVIITVPDNAVQAISVRPRAFNIWTGIAYYDDFSLNGQDIVTSVEDPDPTQTGDVIPTDFRLNQNYPNPFNPTTYITYDLANSGAVTLDIYSLIGQKVKTLVDGVQTAGTWGVEWNGTDFSGAQVSSGVYFYQLRASGFLMTRKMLLMK